MSSDPQVLRTEETPCLLFPELFAHSDSNGISPMGGPAMQYNANISSAFRWPRSLAGQPLFYEWSRDYAKVMQLNRPNGHQLADIQHLFGGKTSENPNVVLDNPTTLPFWVRNAAQHLKGNVGHYIFISTLSVYPDNSVPDADETAGVTPMPDGVDPYTTVREHAGQYYGAMKSFSEQEVARQYGSAVTILRSGLIVGPLDRSDRLTYWPARIDRGGEVLAPVLARGTFQWVVALADGGLSTPAVYAECDRLRGDAPVPEPRVGAALMAALRSGDPDALGAALRNDLQDAACTLRPALRQTLETGQEAGALGATAGAASVVLTHFSSRYPDVGVLLDQARARARDRPVTAAADLDRLPFPGRRAEASAVRP